MRSKYSRFDRSTIFLLLISFFSVTGSFGQLITEKAFVERMNLAGGFPQKLLVTRSVVIHSYTFTEKELNLMQEYFQRTGLDAVSYFPLDLVTAGRDVEKGFLTFLNKREISNLVFAEKFSDGVRISVTAYSGKDSVVTKNQPAWSISNRLLLDALKTLNKTALSELKRENLLVNDFAETDLTINPITGKRNEFFAVDMKVDLVAVPTFGIDSLDDQLATIFASHFPFAYKLVDPTIPEKDLRKQGMLYVFSMIHTRAILARQLLQYAPTPSESAFVSITYPGAEAQTKTIGAHTSVFKVYFKHIDSGNVFLGNKWDADTTWQQALINNIKAMKAELRLN